MRSPNWAKLGLLCCSLDVVRSTNHRCSLWVVVGLDHPVSEGRCNFLERLLLCLTKMFNVSNGHFDCSIIEGHVREKEVCYAQEEKGACHEDIIVVLFDVGECTGAGLGD